MEKSIQETKSNILKVLVTQPRPQSDKSPYYELERKYNIALTFAPFIVIEPITAKEFRRQKVDIAQYSAIIFTSKNAIDHFFRMCEELKVNINQDNKYFCINEQVALYLQKFILYRKRKVFFSADGTNKGLFDVIKKHKENEQFLYPVSENQQDNDIVNWLKDHGCDYANPFMYRSISANVKELIGSHAFDIICFFTPSGIRSLYESVPDYQQNGTMIGVFGSNTLNEINQRGLSFHFKAPEPDSPSMVTALDHFLAKTIGEKNEQQG